MNAVRNVKTAAVLACAAGCAVAVPVASGSGTKPKPVVKQVQVADNYFSKTKLTIKPGNSVNWVWSDTNFDTHNVTLFKGPKGIKKSKFTSLDGTRDFHFKRVFATAGTYHFECTIHPSMLITVTVKK